MSVQTSQHCARHSSQSEADLDHQDTSTVTTHGANPLRASGYLWTERCSGQEFVAISAWSVYWYSSTYRVSRRCTRSTQIFSKAGLGLFTWEQYINIQLLLGFHAVAPLKLYEPPQSKLTLVNKPWWGLGSLCATEEQDKVSHSSETKALQPLQDSLVNSHQHVEKRENRQRPHSYSLCCTQPWWRMCFWSNFNKIFGKLGMYITC